MSEPKPWRFQPGQSGNPRGRPKGARSRLSEAFLEKLAADFEENGEGVIIKVRAEKPADYLKVVASLLPKQVEVKDAALDDLSDAELADIVLAAREARRLAEEGGDSTQH